MNGKGRDGSNSATAQGWFHRFHTVREVGWEGQEKRCAVVWGAHGRRDRGRVNGKGRDGRNSATAQGRSHRSRTVREVGWEGQEKRCAVVWGAPRQEGHSASGLRPTLSK